MTHQGSRNTKVSHVKSSLLKLTWNLPFFSSWFVTGWWAVESFIFHENRQIGNQWIFPLETNLQITSREQIICHVKKVSKKNRFLKKIVELLIFKADIYTLILLVYNHTNTHTHTHTHTHTPNLHQIDFKLFTNTLLHNTLTQTLSLLHKSNWKKTERRSVQ